MYCFSLSVLKTLRRDKVLVSPPGAEMSIQRSVAGIPAFGILIIVNCHRKCYRVISGIICKRRATVACCKNGNTSIHGFTTSIDIKIIYGI